MPPNTIADAAPLRARAIQLLRAGRIGEAIVPLREAAALQPLDAALQHDLGLACLELGDADGAVTAFERAIAGKPGYADAQFRLGIARERLGDTSGAIRAYHAATRLLPSFTEAWFRAGALVLTLGYRQEAIGCFRRAASAGPKTSFGRLGAARALLAEDRDQEAERVLRRMLALDPDHAMAQDLLANVLADAGAFDEARIWFERAIAAAPLMAGSYYDLVRCRRIAQDDGDLLERMRAALAIPGLDGEHRTRVHLALGKAADDLGEYATAMQHFDAADALRSRTLGFDAVAFDAQIDRMIARFSPALMAQADRHGCDDATPILVVGMPRSGTTLVEQIISCHPDVAAGGELNFWNERGIAWHAAGASLDDRGFLHDAAADYLAVLGAIGPDRARVTDKMPFNFIWAGLIHLAVPGATIIHCRRAAIDVALSIHQTHFNPTVAFPAGGAALVAYIRSYQRIVAHWRRVLPAGRFVEIDYAALTATPEPAIRRLIAACGLPWDDACLHPERNPRVVKTPSKWQARQPIYRTAVERWRGYEPFLGPLRELLEPEQI